MSRARLIAESRSGRLPSLVAVLPFALALLGGACGGNTAAPPSPAVAVTATTEAAAPTTVPSPSTTTKAATPTTRAGGPTPTTKAGSGAPIPAGKLLVRAGGISTIDFGAPEADTMARLSARLGTPERGDGVDSVCPGYRWARWSGPEISVYFDPEGTLVGWSAQSAAGAETAEKVAVGTKVAALRQTYGPRFTIEETSLGHQFMVTDEASPERPLVGVVDRTDDTGTVTGLWSGFTCTAH